MQHFGVRGPAHCNDSVRRMTRGSAVGVFWQEGTGERCLPGRCSPGKVSSRSPKDWAEEAKLRAKGTELRYPQCDDILNYQGPGPAWPPMTPPSRPFPKPPVLFLARPASDCTRWKASTRRSATWRCADGRTTSSSTPETKSHAGLSGSTNTCDPPLDGALR